jgi:FlgD Ig-like domain
LQSNGDPVIGAFWAEPPVIDLYGQSRLSWSVVDAPRVILEPMGIDVTLDGSVVVQPDTTTTYTLRAQNGGVEVTQRVTVEVIAVRIERFTATPTRVYPGDAVTLEWAVVNADSVWIEPDVGGVDQVSGTVSAVPRLDGTVYTIHAARVGEEVVASDSVGWMPPRARLLAGDLMLVPREWLPLRTDIAGADSARVQPGNLWIEPLNGFFPLSVPGGEAQTFRLTAYNRAGATTDELDYEPRPPSISFYSDGQYEPYLGRWQLANVYVRSATRYEITAPSVLAAPLVEEPNLGTVELKLRFWLDDPMIIRVAAENFLYSVEDSLPLGEGSRRIVELSVDDPVVARGDSTTLRWVVHVDWRSLESGVIEPLGVSLENELGEVRSEGNLVIQPQATMQYRGVFGQAVERGEVRRFRGLVTVQVVDGQSSLVAEPMQPVQGSVFDLHVAMPSDATEARLEPGFGAIDPQSQTLQLVAGGLQEYRLEVTTPRGAETARLVVEPGGSGAVPTLVTRLEFTGHVRGPSVALNWNVQTIRPPQALRIERSEATGDLQFWRALESTEGELVDVDVRPGAAYTYRVRFEIDGQPFESDAVVVRPELRLQTRLLPNIPNPFNPSTEIRWDLAAAGRAKLEIYDLRGRRVRSVDLGFRDVGTGGWAWDGRDDHGGGVGSGSYIARLSSGPRAVSRKIVLAK